MGVYLSYASVVTHFREGVSWARLPRPPGWRGELFHVACVEAYEAWARARSRARSRSSSPTANALGERAHARRRRERLIAAHALLGTLAMGDYRPAPYHGPQRRLQRFSQ